MRLLVGVVRLIVWVASGAVGMYEAGGRPAAAVFGDGLVGQRRPDAREPGFPLGEGVWWTVGEQQRFPAQRAESALDPQEAFPRLHDLWGFVFTSPVGPVVG